MRYDYDQRRNKTDYIGYVDWNFSVANPCFLGNCICMIIEIRNITEDQFGTYSFFHKKKYIGNLEYTTDGDILYLDSMWLSSEYRGRDIAEKILKFILKQRTEKTIDCHVISMQSLKFLYKVLGYPTSITNRFLKKNYSKKDINNFISIAKQYLVDCVDIDCNGNFIYKEWFILKFKNIYIYEKGYII